MKTLFYPSFNELTIADRPLPEISQDEVLVKVAACGICGSELETFQKRSKRRMPPIIMGHEFSGVIVQAGEAVTGWPTGTRIVSNSVVSCGTCPACGAGKTNLCSRRQIFGMERNGGFAQYVNVPSTCLVRVPDRLSLRKACLAEPLANGVHIVQLTQHLPIRTVLIIGAGPIGLMSQQAFQSLKAVSIIVTDLKADRLNAARQLGATHIIDAGESSLLDRVMALTDGQGVDLVIDAVGAGKTNQDALSAVKTGGTIVMIGLHENSCSLSSYDIILPEKQVLGTYAAKLCDIADAVQLMADNKVDVTSWVSYYLLDEGTKAFRAMLDAAENHIKSVIVVDENLE